MKYLVGLPQWLARRGVSSLVVDQPGTGEALRLHGMQARYDSEHWASRIVDWLEQHPEVDAGRIGMEGSRWAAITARGRWRLSRASPAAWCGAPITTGGRYSSAAANAKAIFRYRTTGSMCAGCGGEDIDAFMRIAENVHLDGILDRIRVPSSSPMVKRTRRSR